MGMQHPGDLGAPPASPRPRTPGLLELGVVQPTRCGEAARSSASSRPCPRQDKANPRWVPWLTRAASLGGSQRQLDPTAAPAACSLCCAPSTASH